MRTIYSRINKDHPCGNSSPSLEIHPVLLTSWTEYDISMKQFHYYKNFIGQVALFISITLTTFATITLTSSSNDEFGSMGNTVAGITRVVQFSEHHTVV